MWEKILEILIAPFREQINDNPKLFVWGVVFLLTSMGTIFGLMQIIKVVIKAFRKKESHGLPLAILVLSPLALGYGFMWGHYAFFPIFTQRQMVALGVLLGAANIGIYEVWKRREKICNFIKSFRIGFGASNGK